ncbi:MAG: glycosyltransferase family 1 protein [Fimbriimonadaceae bacterium]
MKVLLVGNYIPDRQYSMLGFADAMQRGLSGHVEFEHIAPEPIFGGPDRSKWFGYLDKFVCFPRKLRRTARRADLVHILDHSNAVYLPHVANRPHLVTCHDVLPHRAVKGEFPGWQIGRTGRAQQRWIARNLRRARNVVCVSQATLEDAVRVLGLERRSLRVVLNGTYKPICPMDETQARVVLNGRFPERFILHVGGSVPYKNRPGVIRAFAASCRWLDRDVHLVLVGKPPWEASEAIVEELGIADRVVMVSHASDREVQAAYCVAESLFFLSYAEGFGLPVLEAMACGCPVVASNRAPMTEVGGDVPLYVDPDDPEDAAAQIHAWWPNRRSKVAAGLERVHLFSLERMVGDYLRTYQDLAG